jgi:predicted phage terminase large subunit-like protein
MIKANWFRTYNSVEMASKFDIVMQSWDTANKCAELNDYSVCTTWGVIQQRIYLLNVLRKRLDYPDLRRAVKEHAQLFKARNVLIEDKASGTQLIQDLRADGVYSVTCYMPQMDKIMRMHSVSSTIENGFVFLPEQASWLVEYLHELAIFPNGKYDDQVDSTSQALDWIKAGSQVLGVVEYVKQEAMRIFEPKLSDRVEIFPGEQCPNCRFICIVKLPGPQKRCSQCGHQWPDLKRIQQEPSRRFC